MIEVDDPADLPPYPFLVRRRGRAVAAYRSEQDAHAHAVPHEDAEVWPDRCTGLPTGSVWRMAGAQRDRDRAALEALIAQWLAGDWWTWT